METSYSQVPSERARVLGLREVPLTRQREGVWGQGGGDAWALGHQTPPRLWGPPESTGGCVGVQQERGMARNEIRDRGLAGETNGGEGQFARLSRRINSKLSQRAQL